MVQGLVAQAPPHREVTYTCKPSSSGYWNWLLALLFSALSPQLESLRNDLSQVALRDQAQLSSAFADLVLANWRFPAPALALLADFFDWGNDVRVDRVLGTQRSIALRTRLDGVARTTGRRLKPLAYYRQAVSMEQLLGSRGSFWALGYALMAHPSLIRQVYEIDSAIAARLGMDPYRWETCRFLAQLALCGRALAVGLVLFATLGLSVDTTAATLTHTGWLIAALLGSLVVSGFVEGSVVCLDDALATRRHGQAHMPAGFAHAASVAVLLMLSVLLAAASRKGLISETFVTVCACGVLSLVALMVWPRERQWRFSLVPIGVGLFVMLRYWPDPRPTTWTAMIAATLWMLAAHWIMLSHHGQPCRHVEQPLRRYLHPGYLAAATVALPLALLVGTYRYGIGHLLSVLGMAWAISLAYTGTPNGLLFAVSAAVLNVLLAILHERLAWRAEGLLQR